MHVECYTDTGSREPEASGLQGIRFHRRCRTRGIVGGTGVVMEEEILYSESFKIRGNDFEHGGEVAAAVKAVMKQLSIRPDVIRRLSIANFEAEMNVIMYAEEADFEFSVLPNRVCVVCKDRGQGIPDLGLAMQEGWSTATPQMRERGFGAGLGLPNIKRNSDRFEIESTPGVGTTLRYCVSLE
jgi:serine/threonine-protein kinase RsbT